MVQDAVTILHYSFLRKRNTCQVALNRYNSVIHKFYFAWGCCFTNKFRTFPAELWMFLRNSGVAKRSHVQVQFVFFSSNWIIKVRKGRKPFQEHDRWSISLYFVYLAQKREQFPVFARLFYFAWQITNIGNNGWKWKVSKISTQNTSSRRRYMSEIREFILWLLVRL